MCLVDFQIIQQAQKKTKFDFAPSIMKTNGCYDNIGIKIKVRGQNKLFNVYKCRMNTSTHGCIFIDFFKFSETTTVLINYCGFERGNLFDQRSLGLQSVI